MLGRTPAVDRWLDDLRQDLRYALRALRHSPGFTALVALTLAIGIGANTAIVSLMHTVLLRELPVTDPQDLVFIRTAGDRGLGGAPPYPYFDRIRDEGSSFSGMAAFAADELRVEVNGSVEQVFGQVASGNYFQLLGVTPAAGRLMTADDERLDPPVAVIGYGYWQRRFGGAPDAIGRTLSFRNRAFTIVGVTPPPFHGLEPGRQVDVTLPITLEPAMIANVEAQWFNAVARLRPGVDARQAAAQANASVRSLTAARSASAPVRFERIELTPASRGLDQLRARFSGPLYAMTLVTGILLLIACANLGGLLLVRGAMRTREFALRVATGASSGRLLKQVLTETLVLFMLGAAAGLFVAYAGIEAITGFVAMGRRPILLDMQYDWRLIIYALCVTLATGVVTGLWPAVRAMRLEPQTAMKENDSRFAGSRRSGGRRVLVAGQVALSLALLVAAALFARTMVNLRAVDLGFTPGGVLTMSLDPALPRVAGSTDPALPREVEASAREQLWTSWLERVRGVPDVRSASLSVLTPLSGRNTGVVMAVPGLNARGDVRLNHVSEDYFRTFGIDLLAGRSLTRQDGAGAPKVVVLNETAARAAFAGRSPVGERVELGDAGLYQVVGVVRNYKHLSVREPAQPFAFVPLSQPVIPISRLTLSVSSTASGPTARERARTIADDIRAIRANTLVSDVIAVEQQIDETLVSERSLSMLATGFAALVLALAAIGLYGIVSYAATARTTEFGLRLALGAPRSRVAAGVIGEAMRPVAAGIAIGLPLAVMIARAAQRLLFGVTPSDSSSYLVGAGALIVVAAAAAWLPARRACALDPAETLRRG